MAKEQKGGQTVGQLVDLLCECFPDFREVWEMDSTESVDPFPPSHHSVFLSFNPYFSKFASTASDKQLCKFADFLNDSVAAGGWQENLVSTAFLEHLNQFGGKPYIWKYLSSQSKAQSHA